jgi:hypothetical protein
VRWEERLGGLLKYYRHGDSRVKEGELQWAGFNMAGLLCLVLMVLKLERLTVVLVASLVAAVGWCCGTTPCTWRSDSSG